MADPFPAEPAALLDHFRVMVAHLAVKRSAGADAITGQHLHQPPDADAVSVITHRPVAHVGDLGLFAWDAIIEVARHDVVEAEELDIRVDPKRDASAIRPGQREAAVDRDIGEGTVATRRHARAPEGGGKDYSRLSNLPKAHAG